MITPPVPQNEDLRLKALAEYDLMDTEAETDYDAIVTLASAICQTPISLISLIDQDRQWFKAKTGLPNTETKRNLAFCAFNILDNTLMEVQDTLLDDRFIAHPLVDGDPNIRFYAGIPLRSSGGYNLGSLCVIDRVPRKLTEFQRTALNTLGRQVVNMFELRRKNRELQHIQVVQNRLLTIIGHDLRTPITSINLLMELCADEQLTLDDFKQIVPEIRRSSESTGILIENLIAWASSQFNGLTVRRHTLRLDTRVAEFIEENRNVFEAKGNSIRNDVPEGHELVVDPDMTSFILRNLILNANKFTANGQITIGAEKDGFYVHDTGTGIPVNLLPALFEFSKRTSLIGTAGERGSGLGLPMSHEFAVAHGGRITVESEPGQGSVFHVILS